MSFYKNWSGYTAKWHQTHCLTLVTVWPGLNWCKFSADWSQVSRQESHPACADIFYLLPATSYNILQKHVTWADLSLRILQVLANHLVKMLLLPDVMTNCSQTYQILSQFSLQIFFKFAFPGKFLQTNRNVTDLLLLLHGLTRFWQT